MDDASAIQRCQAGDVEAFRHLVDRYQAEAIGHAAAILGRPEDAADAAQEAFVKAFRALGRFDLGRRFYPWFYTILRHCCFKLAAKRKPTEPIGSEALAVLAAPQGEPDGMVRLLERALRRLPAADRELITLKHLDGLSYAELAERLEIPAGTVMSRLYHARGRLRGELDRLRRGNYESDRL